MSRRSRPSNRRRQQAGAGSHQRNRPDKSPPSTEVVGRKWIILLILASYAALAIVMTWPVAGRLTTHIAGEHADLYVTQWDCWWVNKVITEWRNPLHTEYLFYPNGGSLRYHSTSWLTGLIAAPLRWIAGATAAYNLTFLLQTVLCAVAMFALVLHQTRRRDAAWLAGLTYAFAPYRLAQATAHPNLAFLAAIPLVVLCLTKALQDRAPRWAWLAALSLALVLLTGAHLFIMTTGLVTIIVIISLIQTGNWRSPTTWKVLAHFGGGCILLVAPLMLQYVGGDMDTANSLVEADNRPTDVAAWITPSRIHPWWGDAVRSTYEKFDANRPWIATLGYAALLLSAIGALSRQTRKPMLAWTTAAIVFALFCVGPKLYIAGHAYEWPMPYRLVEWLSPVQAIRSPDRFNLMLITCLSVGVGWGWTALRHWRVRHPIWLLTPTMVLLLEYWPYPYPTTRAIDSKFFEKMRLTEDNGAILDIPLSPKPSKFAMCAQTVHEHPIVGGFIARALPESFAFIESSPLLVALRANAPPPLDCAAIDVRGDLQKLRATGVKHVVLWRRWAWRYTRGGWPRLFATRPIHQDKIIIVFDLDAMLRGTLPCD